MNPNNPDYAASEANRESQERDHREKETDDESDGDDD